MRLKALRIGWNGAAKFQSAVVAKCIKFIDAVVQQLAKDAVNLLRRAWFGRKWE